MPIIGKEEPNNGNLGMDTSCYCYFVLACILANSCCTARICAWSFCFLGSNSHAMRNELHLSSEGRQAREFDPKKRSCERLTSEIQSS